jgi:hypothetical protein
MQILKIFHPPIGANLWRQRFRLFGALEKSVMGAISTIPLALEVLGKSER